MAKQTLSIEATVLQNYAKAKGWTLQVVIDGQTVDNPVNATAYAKAMLREHIKEVLIEDLVNKQLETLKQKKRAEVGKIE